MPDLITHASMGYFIKKMGRQQRGMVAFIAGNCLPDFISRGPSNFLRIFCELTNLPEPLTFLRGLSFFHEPLGYLLFCWGVIYFFPPPERKSLFANLAAGGLLHYLVDITQHHIRPGYMPLFPFSTLHFEIGCIGSETTIYFIPLWLVLVYWIYRRDKENYTSYLHQN